MNDLKSKLAMPLIVLLSIAGGSAISYAAIASADTASSTANVTSAVNSGTVQTNPAAGKPMGHAPIGNDGNVTSINGTTILMQEEADEGGAIYTVDASSATVTKDGAAASITSIAVGDKIFIQGSVNGTSVTATSVSDGHPKGGFGGPHGR